MDDTDTPPSPEVALAEARARADALEQRMQTLQRETEQRLIRAEMKAEAVRAGMVDLDGLKLLDLSAAKLTETGEVEGAAALMARLRRDKPWLFAPSYPPSSSSTAAAPPAAPAPRKLATEMTDAEYRTARAELLKRRY